MDRMSRNFVRSDYHAAEVSWLDWLTTATLLLTALWATLIANSTLIGALALAAGCGFGFFITVAELGRLSDPR